MLDDLAGLRTGERIQRIRERRGMSRPVLAGLVGRSASWLKGIETGRRLPPRVDQLARLAVVLNVSDVMELAGVDLDLPAGGTSLPVTSFSRIPHDSIPAVREAIHHHVLTPDDHAMDIESLASRVEQAWRLWHASPTQRTDVGRVLPTLITDTRAATRSSAGPQRRRAYALLADVYGLAEQLLSWTSEPELLMIAADRGITAAQEADQPETLAGAAWVVGNVRRAIGDYEGALELIDDARALLRPRLEGGSAHLRGMWGALHLHAAITCARAGREGDAWAYWDEGHATAERLGADYVHPWTVFSRGNVAVHAVSVGADLGQPRTARDRAELVDPDSVPSLDRRARLLIETARPYHQRGDHGGALHWLRRAYSVSSETVHYAPLARQMASDIVDQGGPLIEREARKFGELLGLAV
ncbi:helix-turn-helix domain-containing protein [Bailinhaonella thermotolerans]|uniref:XRE family transcriptional regulator n=1 Tax=Bailinhaonella thermotolerans TaxID=1070861 RepID=A0A3A4AH00_9ACTN|nr:helix-turn-helix domain-containing protein [Bailinhaonella thermotolerans]RJL19730.1 XRE family transcriptional regulator [Bailinhaonella thermotolerans]